MRGLMCGLALAVAAAGWARDAAAADDPLLRPKFGRNHRGLGLGISVGDPMGASLKYFLHPAHALSGHLAWGILHHGDGIVTVDYHFHTRPIGDTRIVEAHVYVGFGVGVGFWAAPGPSRLQAHDRSATAGAAMMIRVPALGLAYHWRKFPIDTSLEGAWSPYVVLPDLRHGDVSIKVRYFF